ncbi:ABC transporter permease [Enteractinococcus helveticum]|uniref:ABC transporter permease n=1 Tax=Enteractinococcus helveticum TaxID=1837282 RepID=A0A1B7M1R1_9MICC|nr:ABC transporter permease [Enteractinococcus helveticum]OAV62495.1 ABC transporter permease [Enteractinococcus helveticum]
MNVIEETFSWLFAANTWSPTGEDLVSRSLEHLWYSSLAVAIAALIAIPSGWCIGHTKKFSGLIIGITGAARALPTLGLITLFGLLVGIGLVAPMIALVILAIPSILAGTYSGISAINPAVLDAARAQGLTTGQLIWRVHLPLGLSMLVGGLRSASIQVMSTAILAAYVGAGGLGRFIFLGINTQNTGMLLGTSVWIMVLVVVIDALFATAQRLATPVGVRMLGASRAATQRV